MEGELLASQSNKELGLTGNIQSSIKALAIETINIYLIGELSTIPLRYLGRDYTQRQRTVAEGVVSDGHVPAYIETRRNSNERIRYILNIPPPAAARVVGNFQP
jgi:hypothetical protein